MKLIHCFSIVCGVVCLCLEFSFPSFNYHSIFRKFGQVVASWETFHQHKCPAVKMPSR
jgi:hypothetical protein